MGDRGALVTHLQRTLNARLKPSPELTVDGEFGNATESAVRTLQRQAGLEVSGKLSRDTWKALGL